MVKFPVSITTFVVIALKTTTRGFWFNYGGLVMPASVNTFVVMLLTIIVFAVAQVFSRQSKVNAFGRVMYIVAKECWQVIWTVQLEAVA